MKYRPDQLRDSDGKWTLEGGGGGQRSLQPGSFDSRWGREAVRKTFEAAIAFFAGLSARNGPDQQAVIAFKARDFRPGEGGGTDLESVGLLDRDTVNAECPRLGEVQARTDAAAAAVDREAGNFTPATYGTAVHTNLKRQIDDLNDPNFKAEKSFLKAQEEVRYGAKDSIVSTC